MFLTNIKHNLTMLIILFLMTISLISHAESTLILRDANIIDVIHLLAKMLNKNVIIHSEVAGRVSLKVNQPLSETTLDFLLQTQDLGKLKQDQTWYVAPKETLLQQKKKDLEWKNLKEESLPLVTKLWNIRYAKVETVEKLLRGGQSSLLSRRGQIQVDSRSNVLLVRDTPHSVEEINRFVTRVDKPLDQIVIEARIASVDSDCEKELGIDFGTRLTKATELSNNRKENNYTFAILKLANHAWLDIKLAALEKQGRAQLISSPSLFTTDREPASIEAGEEVPYQESTEGGGTAVVFKKAVLGLKVKPHVLPNQLVLLELHISQDRPSNNLVQGVPTIKTRQIRTNVVVKGGQTIVLGGIYESNYENGVQGIPLLSRIPVLGYLFMQRSNQAAKRELLIFVTPKIVPMK